ncbi:MAG: hypothetical protein EOP84_12025 [Verrucomicrobiaceae bacterium]|nr:MAG: hypothetical protein EOP84_12025 [Verrucomicrobiaceae bacterium]
MSAIPRTLVVAVAMAAAPILPILSTGMEHCMHIWALAGLFSALMAISAGKPVRPGIIFFWAAMAAGSRYESMFFLPVLMIWLTLSQRWRALFELAGGMAAVVIGFGIYSTLHGGFFLPNTLMIKGAGNKATIYTAIWIITDFPDFTVLALGLFVASICSLASGNPATRRFAWLPCAVFVALLIHLRLARTGTMWRYESYLMAMGVIAVTPLLSAALKNLANFRKPAAEFVPPKILLNRVTIPRIVALSLAPFPFILALGAAIPLVERSIVGHKLIVPAAGNIRDQQIQMGRLVQLLGDGAGVGVNDLGAVSFFTDARILDLWGLGDDVMARAVHGNKKDTAFLRKRIDDFGADYVICYPSWFATIGLPSTLIPVEQWKLNRNIICGDSIVCFYGASPPAAARLRQALDEYHALPQPNPPLEHHVTPLD